MEYQKRCSSGLNQVFDVAPCGMLIVDASGLILLVNKQLCLLFGYEELELIGAPLEVLLPERHRAAHILQRDAYSSFPSVRAMGLGRDLTGRHKENYEVPVEVGIAPIKLDDGSSGAIATVTDITSRKKLESNLRQANANLEEFNHVASHDLKAPLRGIRSLVEWIQEDLGEVQLESVIHNFERLILRIDKMDKLIEDLLQFSRCTSNTSDITQIELPLLIQHEIELLAPPDSFVIHLDCQETFLTSSHTALATVIRNILDNAIKHHHQTSGNIYITISGAGAFCKFSIVDDGPGIPENARKRIFQLFQTVNKNNPYAGVGLAVCKRLVDAYGGSIEVAANTNGQGSAFIFYWPKYARRDING